MTTSFYSYLRCSPTPPPLHCTQPHRPPCSLHTACKLPPHKPPLSPHSAPRCCTPSQRSLHTTPRNPQAAPTPPPRCQHASALCPWPPRYSLHAASMPPLRRPYTPSRSLHAAPTGTELHSAVTQPQYLLQVAPTQPPRTCTQQQCSSNAALSLLSHHPHASALSSTPPGAPRHLQAASMQPPRRLHFASMLPPCCLHASPSPHALPMGVWRKEGWLGEKRGGVGESLCGYGPGETTVAPYTHKQAVKPGAEERLAAGVWGTNQMGGWGDRPGERVEWLTWGVGWPWRGGAVEGMVERWGGEPVWTWDGLTGWGVAGTVGGWVRPG